MTTNEKFYLKSFAADKFMELNCIKKGAEAALQQIKMSTSYYRNRDTAWNPDTVSMLDEDKMMKHIMSCCQALIEFQQYRDYVAKEQPADVISIKTNEAKIKIFTLGLTMTSIKLRYLPESGSGLLETGMFALGRPLDLATLALGTPEGDVVGLTEDDVRLIYESDPEAARSHGYTPVHFLCELPPMTCRMNLLPYLVSGNEEFLSRSDFPPLHIACKNEQLKNEQLSEELLRFLVKVFPAQAGHIGRESDGYCTPLELLIQNACCNERLMACLLEANSSVDVVGRGISKCLEYSEGYPSALQKIDMLLKANPEVVKQYRDDYEEQYESRNWLHRLAGYASMPPALCIDIMKRFLAIHPGALKEVDQVRDGGALPIHNAAQYGSLDVMKFLLGLNPEMASVLCPAFAVNNNNDGEEEGEGDHEDVDILFEYEPDGLNLLHLVVYDHRGGEDAQAKVAFLCREYPEMLSHRGHNGTTPFHADLMSLTTTAWNGSKVGTAAMIPIVRMMCEIGGGPALAAMPTVSVNAGYSCNGWLPLHYFINHFSDLLNSSLFSEATDLFHLMLQWYPEAASIEAGNGVNYRKTPYQLAVDKNLDTYYLRFLLRAAPDLNPAELRRLNFAERRMAMFLAFSAVSAASRPLLMSKLRSENMDLMRLVVSFL